MYIYIYIYMTGLEYIYIYIYINIYKEHLKPHLPVHDMSQLIRKQGAFVAIGRALDAIVQSSPWITETSYNKAQYVIRHLLKLYILISVKHIRAWNNNFNTQEWYPWALDTLSGQCKALLDKIGIASVWEMKVRSTSWISMLSLQSPKWQRNS